MTRRRWIADEVREDRAAVTGAHAQHLARVLRARIGQEFDINAGSTVRRGRITSISDARVEFELGDALPATHLPEINLLLSIFKFDRMEWAIEKCTELGVARIVPVIARRTDSHLVSAVNKRSERWKRLIRQASEQSRRSAGPELGSALSVQDAMHVTAAVRIVLSEQERTVSLSEALASHSGREGLTLAIGPEGGWTDDEIAAFASSGWTMATLGPTILRAETAAIAAVAVAMSALS
jgi:16S rRNA (uracil1498-N3)-methyltransferase